MAVVADADGDESGLDAAQDLTGPPDVEAPEIQGVPDVAVGDDATSAGDENDQDVGSQSSDDASGGSSSGSGSGSSSGSSGGGSGSGTIIDSGSGAPPSETPDASVESGGSPDSGGETSGPTSLEGGRETFAPHLGGALSVHPAPGGSPSTVDDKPGSPRLIQGGAIAGVALAAPAAGSLRSACPSFPARADATRPPHAHDQRDGTD
jgi:hypothetical protein